MDQKEKKFLNKEANKLIKVGEKKNQIAKKMGLKYKMAKNNSMTLLGK